ncbi:AF4/FMR2 family member 4 [Ditylenchus destructor]|nr:AF4/FMR2 family member 4 [Ditylenchus destructor]
MGTDNRKKGAQGADSSPSLGGGLLHRIWRHPEGGDLTPHSDGEFGDGLFLLRAFPLSFSFSTLHMHIRVFGSLFIDCHMQRKKDAGGYVLPAHKKGRRHRFGYEGKKQSNAEIVGGLTCDEQYSNGLLTPAVNFQSTHSSRAIATFKMQSGTQTGPKTVIEPSDVKKRLDSVFGSYTTFSELIVKPGFNSSSIYGVVPIPMSPVINGTPAPFSSTQGYHPVSTNTPAPTTSPEYTERPSYSANDSGNASVITRVPTKDVLESMQRLVDNEPLSTLDCSRNKNCIVNQDSQASTSTAINGDLPKGNKKRAPSSSPEQPVEKKRKKKHEESRLQTTNKTTKHLPVPDIAKTVPEGATFPTNPSVSHCQKEETKTSSSPRIVIKLPRPPSTSSLSTIDGHSEKKEKQKKHKSEKHKSESRESKHSHKSERKRDISPFTAPAGDNLRHEEMSDTKMLIQKEEPMDEPNESEHRYQLADVKQILEHFGRVSPLISPLHRISPPTELLEDETPQPSPYNAQKLVKCHLNLTNLSPKRCQKLTSKWHKLIGLEPLLSPAMLPSATVVENRSSKPEEKRRVKLEKDVSIKENVQENQRSRVVSNARAAETEKPTKALKEVKKEEPEEEKIKLKFRPSEKPQPESPKPSQTYTKTSVPESSVKPKAEPVRETEKSKQRQPVDMPPVKREATQKVEETEGRRPSKSKKSAQSSHSTTKSNVIEDVMGKTKPTSKALLEKVESVKETVGYYQNLARKIKHNGDREQDRIKKVMFYLESVVYFIMSASVQKPTDTGDIETNIVNEVTNFLKSTTTNFVESKSEMPHIGHFRARVRTIRGLIQACLTYQLYQIRSLQAQNNFKILRQYEQDPHSAHQQSVKKNANGGESTGANSTTTPSPAASTPSSNRSMNPKEMITVPMDFYSLSFYQNKILNHLMWAHHIWKDSHTQMPVVNRDFIAHLDKLCGEIKMDSDLRDVAIWLLTSVRWMNQEYGELKNPT